MNRRRFLLSIGVIASWSMTKTTLINFFEKESADMHIKSKKFVRITNEKRIYLPENPHHGHCIYIEYEQKTGSDQPQVISTNKTIVYQKDPLILDQSSHFKIIYDANAGDWYINSHV
ncbi:MAG: hypothetical protein ACK4VO_06760 [Pseudobdellovibrio sp.]